MSKKVILFHANITFFKQEDDCYLVESVLRKRKLKSGKCEYRIKWLNYDESHNSWEPECHLSLELIHIFRKQERERRRKRRFLKK